MLILLLLDIFSACYHNAINILVTCSCTGYIKLVEHFAVSYPSSLIPKSKYIDPNSELSQTASNFMESREHTMIVTMIEIEIVSNSTILH